MTLKAKWIWRKQRSYNPYCQTIVAKKAFRLGAARSATVRITADCVYRLYVNDQWVNDGPCRSWPEHYQYDEVDVTSQLSPGNNEIRVIARYWGVGDFHRVPQQAGLLVQLDAVLASGKTRTIISDGSWQVAEAGSWTPNTPKDSIQMGPAELYDARQESRLRFGQAEVLFDAHQGPWKGLRPRDVALLTKKPVSFKSFGGANIVKADGINFCIPVARLVHPGLIEANMTVGTPFGLATIFKVKDKCTVTIEGESFRGEGFRFTVDGRHNPGGTYRLSKGRHLVLGFTKNIICHDKDAPVRLVGPPELRLENPIDAQHENPWCFIPFLEFAFAGNDLVWIWFTHEDEEVQEAQRGYGELVDRTMDQVVDQRTFLDVLGDRAKCIPSDRMFVKDIYWQFLHRRVIGDGSHLVDNPGALMHDNNEMTLVRPADGGDVELLYDLGEQDCGYYCLDLIADAGVCVDFHGVEYMDKDGNPQQTRFNRNAMRYITKQGVNRFLSLRRRSGRYIFVTLRNMKRPVRIRKVELIESTYPVEYIGSFSCGDARLDRIWDISARTLKLCMEDTFTDCPLYEQTLWVGDARNESLFAYGVFDAQDIGRRCIRLAAESLERYPIVGCQVPSSWDCLIPVWSFLWGLSVWDHYWYSGDEKFLRGTWKAVVRNLDGAEKLLDSRGLFSAPMWNMFDWTDIDEQHRTVLHNSMFLVGAIDAALKCAVVLGDQTRRKWLLRFRRRLCRAINGLWDTDRNAYPDSIHSDGTASDSTCQHTSFLAILYDIVGKEHASHALKNVVAPAANVVRVGSPFAIFYLFQMLEKVGQEDEIIKSIYNNYLPMLEEGATTVWETFPRPDRGEGDFLTRSHCHAWSAAPVYFLSRIILGVKQTRPGGKAFEISPRLNGLLRAGGSVATANGPLFVRWEVRDKTLNVEFSVPDGVRTRFVRNETHRGLQTIVNGRPLH